ncbi:MAG: iron-sulfur cluster assembly protein [Anaerolineales bacterium]|nr:iron-sulfur cluster assembly protein [Anaerolineales bacterium]
MSEESTPTTIWEADSTHSELAETLRNRLREVMDPELGLNIIELGLIRDASINAESVHLKMIMTTPFCPYAPALIEMTRSKAIEATGIDVVVEIGMEMWEPSMMEDGTGGDWGLF